MSDSADDYTRAYEDVYPEIPVEDEYAEEHPEITDPKMRELLQPAWAD